MGELITCAQLSLSATSWNLRWKLQQGSTCSALLEAIDGRKIALDSFRSAGSQ